MIIVTGGAGFIGSNLVHGLNRRGYRDILVVDDLTDGTKFKNLVGAEFADYLDKDDFATLLEKRDATLDRAEAIFHQGACSSTTELDGKYLLRNNFEYSKRVLAHCADKSIPFIYASSAAVYGGSHELSEDKRPTPLNPYGFSKAIFDDFVSRHMPTAKTQIVGLRYFNVYGPRESHKGTMSSVAFHFARQVCDAGEMRLFEGTDGYGNGEQRRDFVYVEDVVNTNLWFLDHGRQSGIFNVGTGRSQTFNDVARATIAFLGRGEIKYIPFPEHLRGRYQSFTEARLERLRAAGCDIAFRPVETGVPAYLEWLKNEGLLNGHR